MTGGTVAVRWRQSTLPTKVRWKYDEQNTSYPLAAPAGGPLTLPPAERYWVASHMLAGMKLAKIIPCGYCQGILGNWLRLSLVGTAKDIPCGYPKIILYGFSTSADPEAFVCVRGACPRASTQKNLPTGFDPPIDLHSFTPLHLHCFSVTTGSGHSGDPDRAFLMAPLVAYPNPHAQLGEEEDGHYEWRPEVTVQKTWRQDELKDISKELQDSIMDWAEFRDQIEKMVRLYKPSGAEIAYITPAKTRLRWASLQTVMDHCKHVERQQQKVDTERQENQTLYEKKGNSRLQAAQLMYYEGHGRRGARGGGVVWEKRPIPKRRTRQRGRRAGAWQGPDNRPVML
ncbi:hypothetical protein DPEC_G00188040 [Dallia pectoralis]|uniref:Uncharacterized protein n=1 Tax=Dallia pectoralis TaxID=75939 RepID=A0ACC2GC72_DALPE|nr:hypothetical protein DPEC_G00188040 [Dallia pectoralis]